MVLDGHAEGTFGVEFRVKRESRVNRELFPQL
jgi:hypothetical protein